MDFGGKDEGFLAKIMDFWRRLQILFFCQCLLCILMREVPTLSMCTHTNEGIPSTEHVQMLHWACADMLMRGNPVTDWTHYTHDWNLNRQCLHSPHWVKVASGERFSFAPAISNVNARWGLFRGLTKVKAISPPEELLSNESTLNPYVTPSTPWGKILAILYEPIEPLSPIHIERGGNEANIFFDVDHI